MADMTAVLDACGAGRAVVGGLSLGGYLSLAFWLRQPARVAALLLCDTGPGYRRDDARVITSLPTIDVPALVVGAQDTAFLGAAEYMAARIPGASRVVIDGAGHAANMNQPGPFNSAVASFLGRLA